MDKPYYTAPDGVTRVKPCETIEVDGRVLGAGTEIKVNTTETEEGDNVA